MVSLGDEVKDKVSGFRGVAIARHIYLQGCNRISVQPKTDKEGKLPEAVTFDEPLLEVTKAAKVKGQEPEAPRGGPEKHTDKGKIAENRRNP